MFYPHFYTSSPFKRNVNIRKENSAIDRAKRSIAYVMNVIH